MNRAVELAFRGYAGFLDMTDVGPIQNRAHVYKENVVQEMGKGVDSIFPFLRQQPAATVVLSSATDVKWLKMSRLAAFIPGTDILVAGIGLREPITRTDSGEPIPKSKQKYGIQVDLQDAENEIQLQVSLDGGWYVSYLDSDSYSPYLPHRDAVHPPFRNSFHRARDVLIGITEEARVSLLVDAALRTVYGDDRGFPNRKELEEITRNSLEVQDYAEKVLAPPPPAIHHRGINALFEKLQGIKQEEPERTIYFAFAPDTAPSGEYIPYWIDREEA